MQLAEMQKHVYLARKGTERRMEQGKYRNYGMSVHQIKSLFKLYLCKTMNTLNFLYDNRTCY